LGILGDCAGFFSPAFTLPIFGLDQGFTCLPFENFDFAFRMRLGLACLGSFALNPGLAAALRLETDFCLETLPGFLLLGVFFPLEGRVALNAILSLYDYAVRV